MKYKLNFGDHSSKALAFNNRLNIFLSKRLIWNGMVDNVRIQNLEDHSSKNISI